MPIRWDVYTPPRFSQLTSNTASWNTPPGYSEISGNYINSPLENNINLDFILWLTLFILISLVIVILLKINIRTYLLKNEYFLKKAKEQNVNLENFNLRKTLLINFFNLLQWIFLVLGIIVILWITYKNLIDPIMFSCLFPFSLIEIDFRDSFDWEFTYRDNSKISYYTLQSLTQELKSLLNSLKDDVNYSMSLSFISSYNKWKDNKEKNPPLFIIDAIIVNRESDSILITQFIMAQLDKKGYFISNWLLEDDCINSMDPIILTATVPIRVDI